MSIELKMGNQTLLASKKHSFYSPLFSKSNEKVQKSNELVTNKN